MTYYCGNCFYYTHPIHKTDITCSLKPYQWAQDTEADECRHFEYDREYTPTKEKVLEEVYPWTDPNGLVPFWCYPNMGQSRSGDDTVNVDIDYIEWYYDRDLDMTRDIGEQVHEFAFNKALMLGLVTQTDENDGGGEYIPQGDIDGDIDPLDLIEF